MPELDALRGLAIALVFGFHAYGIGHGLVPLPTEVSLPFAFVRAGNTGVSLFFVLSGFLLARPFLAAADSGALPSWRDFYARRALRILPMYVLVVAVTTAAVAREPGELLPLLGLCLVSRTGRMLGAILLAAVVVAYGLYVTGTVTVPTLEGEWLLGASVLGRGPVFGAGIAAAWLHRRHGERIRACAERVDGRVPWMGELLLLGLLGALGVLLRWMIQLGFLRQGLPPMVAWHVPEGIVWALVLLVVLLAPLRVRWLLCARPLRALGEISYSVFLIHVGVLWAAVRGSQLAVPGRLTGWNAAAFGVVAAATVVCLGLSTLTYRVVEQPFLRRKARFRG
ncbi:MAG: acyltransferase family protein [Candidatus Binatia bacterium]